MINWASAIQQIIDAHADLLETTSELQKWVTGSSGGTAISSVTFDFSDGTSSVVNTIPEIVANASGSQTITAGENLSTGDRVKIYNDGGTAKVKKLVASSFGSASQYNTTSSSNAIAYDSDNGVGVVFYCESIAAGDVEAKIFSITSSITYGSAQTVNTTTGIHTQTAVFHCSGDTTAGTILFLYIDSGDESKIKYKIGTSDGTTITMGSEGDVGSSTTSGISTYVAKYDSTNNMILISAWDNSGFDLILKYGTVDGSTKSISWGTDQTILNDITTSASITEGFALALDEATGTAYVGYSDSSDDFYIRRYTTYNGVISAKTPTQLYVLGSDYSFNTLDFQYDSANDQLILFTGWKFSTVGSLMTFHIRYDTSTESAFELARNTLGAYDTGLFDTRRGGIDLDNNKIFYYAGNLSAAPLYVYEYDLDFTIVTTNSFHVYNEILIPTKNCSIAVVDNLVFFSFKTDLASKYLDERENFAGIIQSNVTSGNDATVSILAGGISTANSGLTIGQKYYLQTDTSIGTTKNKFPVGIALDAGNLRLI